MEQCKICPAKLWSNADFALQNYGAFVHGPTKSRSLYSLPRKIMEQCILCPAKSRRLCSLPRKIMEQCRLCSVKSWRHNYRGQKISSNLIVFSFFLIIFVNHCHFRDLYNPLDHFLRKKYFVSRYL